MDLLLGSQSLSGDDCFFMTEPTIRVALLTHGFYSGGGVPSVVRWLRTGLQKQGRYEVTVHDLATSRADANSRLLTRPATWRRESLLTVDSAGVHRWGANAVELEFMRYKPRREITDHLERYDVLQVVCGTPAWAAVVRGSTRPVILQTATIAQWERQEALVSKKLGRRYWTKAMTSATTKAEKLGLEASDVVLVENREMFDHVKTMGHTNTIIAPPGIDTNTFKPHPRGHNRQGYLLSLCRLGDPRKRLDRLVDAYALLLGAARDCPDLVIAGRGALHDAAKQRIDHHKISERVRVMPDVSAEDLVSLYQGASVFVQTSQEEGLGLSLLEAMACGAPVVATETAGSLETVVDGYNGFLVTQKVEHEIPHKVMLAVSRLLHEDDGRTSTNGRDFCVANFSTAKTLARYTDAYDRAIGQRVVPPSRSPVAADLELGQRLSE
ncbi:glycosyltransferase family 4 protein [Actinoplanes sp. NPDC051494]|uniref:glycosyltransferase family 4 protein n=1 Tax=Actinoplanes sp. NPDC051494 TaxID=3363907 RepID=UPI0037983283